jgi:transposase
MDIHQNARLTPYSREALAQKVLSWQLNQKAAAARFGVTPKTAARWVRRYQAAGRDGLRDHSSRTSSFVSTGQPYRRRDLPQLPF